MTDKNLDDDFDYDEALKEAEAILYEDDEFYRDEDDEDPLDKYGKIDGIGREYHKDKNLPKARFDKAESYEKKFRDKNRNQYLKKARRGKRPEED